MSYKQFFFIAVLSILVLTISAKKLKPKYLDILHPSDEQLDSSSTAESFESHEQFLHNQQQDALQRKRMSKPKSLKVLSAYEQCKLGCKQQRDKESAHEYAEHLRQELQQVEAILAREAAEANDETPKDTVIELGSQ
ncbi:hypothetical protein M3Y95_00556000 [Aphelenchoides besseyi]|nr:hypothetical protein M3Y95_00556000 [Aphelenchoides besseyi]